MGVGRGMNSSWCPALEPSEAGDHQLWGLQPSSGCGGLLCGTRQASFTLVLGIPEDGVMFQQN